MVWFDSGPASTTIIPGRAVAAAPPKLLSPLRTSPDFPSKSCSLAGPKLLLSVGRSSSSSSSSVPRYNTPLAPSALASLSSLPSLPAKWSLGRPAPAILDPQSSSVQPHFSIWHLAFSLAYRPPPPKRRCCDSVRRRWKVPVAGLAWKMTGVTGRSSDNVCDPYLSFSWLISPCSISLRAFRAFSLRFVFASFSLAPPGPDL